MKIFWSWQSDTPGEIGRFFVRDALTDAIGKLKESPEVEDAPRDIQLDHDIKDVTGSPDLVRTIFDKIEKSSVVIADVTIVGATESGKKLINSNVAIELGYALHARTENNVLLVFNSFYGSYEELPFDLRHKGGAIDFNLASEAGRKEIDTQRKLLKDEFARKLRPFLAQQPLAKQELSLKANIKHRRLAVIGGGDDELYQLLVSVENDGTLEATDFRLDLEIPSYFVDGSGYRLQAQSFREGFARFSITSSDPACKIAHFYPGDRTHDIIMVSVGIKGQTKRESPELLGQEITASVFSANMKPRKTAVTIADLRN